MNLASGMFVIVGIIEFLYFRSKFLSSKIHTVVLLALVVISSFYLQYRAPNIIILIIFIISLYRVFNIGRILKGRMHASYLGRTTRRSSYWLMSTQALILIVYLSFIWFSSFGLLMHLVLYMILGLQLLLGITVYSAIVRSRRDSAPKVRDQLGGDLPTVSICIPARNESDDLRDCLDRIVASDYPKLEILVLDDCSSDKHTPEIIRSYAQEGVVFVAGAVPPSYWLAKNWAYDQLAIAANGEIIIFCGVDARLQRQTISKTVVALRSYNSDMISVIPKLDNVTVNPFVQTMRYWWELSLPRNLFKRPPVISTFWAINSTALKKLGGFNSTRRMITPEASFAKQLFLEKKYQFFRDNGVFGLATDKSSRDQTDTAIRTRYPQLHKRPETVFLISSALFIAMVVPFICAFVLWIASFTAALVSVVVAILYVLSYYSLIKEVRQQPSLSVALMFPFAVIVDLFLLHLSMFRYEFGSVEWKGRNICIPVMHVTTGRNTKTLIK